MIESLPIESQSPIQLTLKTNVLSVLQEKYNAQRIVIIVWQIHANEWISEVYRAAYFFIFIQFNLTFRKRTQDQNAKWVVCNTSSWFDDVIEVLWQVHLAESRGDPDLDPIL